MLMRGEFVTSVCRGHGRITVGKALSGRTGPASVTLLAEIRARAERRVVYVPGAGRSPRRAPVTADGPPIVDARGNHGPIA